MSASPLRLRLSEGGPLVQYSRSGSCKREPDKKQFLVEGCSWSEFRDWVQPFARNLNPIDFKPGK
ncbi:hypothetical protein kuro4_23460 [Gelria sp. Kuro-4]|nr:hypothetical protein kuro4_23460 [Gelria sp. Kuro-4]